MKKTLFFLSMVVLLLIGMSSCNDDDNKWSDVDGELPTLKLTSSHIQTDVGRTFTIEGVVSDADGIASIQLECLPLQLMKTIDIIEIYEKPLETYNLSYSFETDRDEIGDSFTIKVTIIDIGGRAVSEDVLVTMDGDFTNPVFIIAPSSEITVLLKEVTRLNVKFSVSDDKAMDKVTVEIPELDYFKEFTSFADGKSLEFNDPIILPSETATYNLIVTAVDKFAHDVVSKSVINVSEMPDFSKMWLSDVKTAAELNSDVFGVPMLIEHIEEYEYMGNYYNQTVGTEIFFLPQKTDFSPICFGIDPLDKSKLTDDPESALPIVLDQANVYYEFTFNIKSGNYSYRTYSVDEAIDPIPHKYGSTSLDTWNDGGSWLQEFYFGYMTGGPKEVDRFTQDGNNPHLFYLENPLFLEAGTEMKFVIHNWHSDGWWNYCTWRVDNSEDPEIFGYYGKEAKYTNPAWTKPDHVGDNWAKPTVNVTGNYKLIFDAHLERAKLIPAN